MLRGAADTCAARTKAHRQECLCHWCDCENPLFLAAQCNTGPSRLWVKTSACYGAGVRAAWLLFEDEGRAFYFFGFEGDGDFDVVGDFDEGVPLFIP